MAREYKIEIADGVNYEFYVHEDDKIEFIGSIEPIGLVHFKRSILHAEEMIRMMRDAQLNRLEVTKL